MRLGSLLMAVAVCAGLGWWFVLRHDTGAEPTTAAASEARTEAGAEAGADAGDAPVRVLVVESAAETVTETKRLRGRTEANRRVEVRAETEGLVASKKTEAGTRVEEGEILCRLDPGAREAELAEARARLAEAEAQASAADQLSQQGFTARTTRIARQAALETARAALDRIRLDIARLEIRAPFAGTLDADTVEKGTRLAPGGLCTELVDLETLDVVAFVSERDVDRLSVGQAVDVRLVNGAERAGKIRFIASSADADTRTYRVEAVIDNADGALRAGMTAEIEVALEGGSAHRLPQSALTLDDEGRLGVRTVVDGRARFRPVRLVGDTAEAALLAGLPARATVIVVGQEFVREGRAVTPVPYGSVDG